ncbi:MAG: hypothetical protein HY275_04205 [Gemmatimonadetes bacterium]|nr:hypothetical protein [Gemmatimonadota bacterium]
MLMRTGWLAFLLLVDVTRAAAQTVAPESFTVRHMALDVAVDFPAEHVGGAVTYTLANWTRAPARTVSFLVNRLMEASSVEDANGAALTFRQAVVRFHDDPMRQVNQVRVTLRHAVPPGGEVTVRIAYGGNLVGYTEIGWLYVRDRVDTAFTILREDALAFPVVDGLSEAANRRRPRTDFTYDATVRVPRRFLVAAGGAASRASHADGTVSWRYRSAGASPFLNLAIAPFDTLVESGVRLFSFPADSAGARRTMASAQAALRTLTRWFGPLHVAPEVTITEIPDGWGSQASLVGGIIQSAAVFHDATQVGELYHELTHLWNARDTDQPSPRWNEGLASFLQGLLRERLDGWAGRPEAEARRIAQLRERAAGDSLLRRVPFVAYGARGITDNAYRVGALLFATLHALVGDAQFQAIVGGYYQAHPRGGSTADFIAFATRASTRDLTAFFDDWMRTTRWVAHLERATTVEDLAAHYR